MERDRLDSFVTHISGASKSITKIKNRGMAKYGLGSTHTTCLRKLYNAPKGLTRTELSDICYLDKAQITRVVNDLVKKGYVSEAPERSSYKRRVVLTEEGKRITTDIFKVVLEVNNAVSGNISEEDIMTFYEVFSKICDGLKRAEDFFEKDSQSTQTNTDI